MTQWTTWGPPLIAAFLASLVEFVEALTIVLAVASVRGWRPALLGTTAAAIALVLLVLILGPLLTRIPIHVVQLAIGMLLLLFGMRWLRKATLRSAGLIPLHDEAAAYASESSALRSEAPAAFGTPDLLALAAAFKAVFLEGLEVVFIVIGVGAAGNHLVAAGAGAGAALVLVIALGVLVHRPLTRVPENTLKLSVGVLVSAFGIFWVGEGLGFDWPGADLAIPAMAVVLIAVALGTAQLIRGRTSRPSSAAR